MAALVEVIIKTIDQGSKTATRELGGELGNLAAKYLSIGAVAGGAYKIIKDSIATTMEYANQVRSLSQISGESAESTSRFIQVLDDYKIGTEQAMTATRALTSQGLSPTIDTLAQLSDEYLKLSSAEEKNAFVIKNLGRGGLQWVEILNKGSEAIKKQGDAVAAGLILNQKQLDQARKLEIAQDTLGESWQQLSMTLGNKLIPAVTEVTDEFNNTTRAIEIMQEGGMSWLDILDNMALNTTTYTDALKQANDETNAQRDAMLQNTEAMQANEETLKAQEEAVKAIDAANQEFLSVLGEVGSAQEEYNSGMVEARDALYAGTITTEEYSAKVAELAASYEDASARIVLSIVEMKLAQDGWTNAELNAYLEIGKQQGVFTESQIKMTRAAIESADELVSSYDELDDPMLHVAERAKDADEAFGGMARATAELGESLRKEGASGAAALTAALNGIPTEINVDVNIRVHGSLPKGIMGGSAGTTLVQCFVAGTLVTLSDGTRKPIEQLQIGDEVRSYNIERREFVAGKVSKIMSRDVTEYLNIDGVLVTEEHPFWHVGRGEWVKAKDIKRNAFLLRDYGGTKVVNFVFKVSEPATVYNLTVDGEHNYFAGGVLVHNKSVDDFGGGATPHASGGMFTIPHAYGNEGFMLGNGDTASGGEKLAISPKGQDFIDYDRLAAAMPRIDYRAMARAMDQVLQQRGY
jgi:hypothetical protein